MVSMLKQKEIRLENVSPNWINTDNLDLLAELEDMMVSSDMFIQQFESYKAKDFKPEWLTHTLSIHFNLSIKKTFYFLFNLIPHAKGFSMSSATTDTIAFQHLNRKLNVSID